MTHLPSSLVWKRLLIERKRMTTSDEIRALARALGKREDRALIYLQEEGYICRILRGVFYVKSADERSRGALDPSVRELVGRALAVKGVGHWYFGMESALKLNGMTHEFFNVEYVITDSFRTTKIIKILDVNFRFIKLRRSHMDFGIVERNGLSFSDPEKTVLDLAYREFLAGKDVETVKAPIAEYSGRLNGKTLGRYLARYRVDFRNRMEAAE